MDWLDKLQANHRVWDNKHFPGMTPERYVVKLTEELGELAHAVHRAQWRDTRAEQLDAIGDICVVLMHLCSAQGWTLGGIIRKVGREVLTRTYNAGTRNEEE